MEENAPLSAINGKRKRLCPKCRKPVVYTLQQSYDRHVKTCGQKLCCPRCRETFSRPDSAKRHIDKNSCKARPSGTGENENPVFPPQRPILIKKAQKPKVKPAYVISERVERNRRANPTTYDPVKDAFGPSSDLDRRLKEGLTTATLLHGGKNSTRHSEMEGEKVRPEIIGFFMQLVNRASPTELHILLGSYKAKQLLKQAKKRLTQEPVASRYDLTASLMIWGNRCVGAPLNKLQYMNVQATQKEKNPSAWCLAPYKLLINHMNSLPGLHTESLMSIKDVITKFGEKHSYCELASDFVKPTTSKKKMFGGAGKSLQRIWDKQNQSAASAEVQQTPTILGQKIPSDIYDIVELVIKSIDGAFFELEPLALRLCRTYASVSAKLEAAGYEPLVRWVKEERVFKLRFSGDGLPNSKSFTHQQTNITLAILNIPHLLHNPLYNRFLFSCNLPEDHPLIHCYISEILRPQIEEMEKKTFVIEPYGECKIKATLLTGDQKALACMFAGELPPGCANFFTTFANVHQSEMSKATFADAPPWTYQRRMEDYSKLAALKAKLDKSRSAESTKETKLRALREELRSRQRAEPYIGALVEKVVTDPLHDFLLTGARQLRWTLDIFKDKIPYSGDVKPTYQSLAANHPAKLFVETLTKNATRDNLAIRSACQEYYDAGTAFRLMGSHCRSIIHSYGPAFLAACEALCHNPVALTKLMESQYVFRQIQLIFGKCSRIDTNLELLSELKQHCRDYFVSQKLFFEIWCTAWIIGHCIPAHSQRMFEEYGLGLGLGSTQSGEHKNKTWRRYQRCTNNKQTTHQILRQDEILSTHLFSLLSVKSLVKKVVKGNKSTDLLMPSDVSDSVARAYCICGVLKTSKGCKMCDSAIFLQISDCVMRGKTTSKYAATKERKKLQL